METSEEADAKMEKAFSEYDESKSQTQKTRDELEEIGAKIDEIKAKGSISPIEEAELANLEKAKSELETILALQEQTELGNAKEAAKTAAHAVETNFGDSLNDMTDEGIEKWETNLANSMNFAGVDTLPQMIAARRYAESLRDAAEVGSDEWKTYSEVVDDYSSKITEKSGELSDYMEKFRMLPEEAFEGHDDWKELYNQMSEAADFVLKELDPAKFTEIKWNEIFNAKEFASAKDELVKAASESRTAATLDDVKEKFGSSLYKSLQDAISESDFSMQDFVDSINSEAGILDMEKLGNQVKENFSKSFEQGLQDAVSESTSVDIKVDPKIVSEESKAFSEWFDNLNAECQEAVSNLQLDPKIDTSGWGLSDYQAWLEEYTSSTEEAVDQMTQYAGDLSDLDIVFDPEGNFKKSVDEYVKDLDTLQAALEKVNKGEFSMHDLIDLQQEFSELNNYDLSNIGVGIMNAMSDIIGSTGDATDAVDEFGNAIEGATDESSSGTGIIGAFNSKINELASVSPEAAHALEQMRDNIISMYTAAQTAQDVLDNFSNYQSMFSGAKSSANSAGGLSTEQIQNLKKAYEGFDISGLFVDSTQGVTLNNKVLEDLNRQIEEETLANLQAKLQEQQAKYSEAKAQNVDTSAIEEEISLTQQLITQYEGMTSAYSQWVNSQSGSNQRDMYSSIGSGYDQMKKTLDAGWYNDPALNAYLDTVLDKSVRTGDALQDFARITQEIQGTGYSIKDFWQYDDNGALQTDGLYNFLNVVRELHPELVSLGQDGAESFDLTGAAIEQLAADTGMSVETIEALVRALTEAEKDWEIKTDVDTSGVEEGESQIDSLRDKIEGNPIVQTIKSKFEGVVEKGKQVFGNLFGGLFGGGSEEEGETQTVKVKQEPDPLELKVTVPGTEGEGSDQTFTVHVKADYGEGGDALQINIEPTGEGLDENGAYTLQTALAGVAEDGTFKLSVPSPDGVEGNTYTLHTAIDKNGNLSIILHEPAGVEGHKYTLDTEISGKAKDGSFTFTLDEPDGVDNGVYKIKVEPADDGKVVVTAVDANGNEAISMPIDPDLEAFGTAIADLRSQLESDPIKIPVEVQNNEPGAKDSYETQQNINSGWKNGGQSPTGRENIVEEGLPTYLQNLTVEGKVVINEVEDQTGGSASVDGTLNATNVNDETGGSANVEGTVNATNVDTSNVETPTIEANVAATGEVSGTANANADNSGVQQAVSEATSLIEGMNDVTGTAHIEADNSALQSAVQESDIKIKSVNSMTGEGKIKANDSDLVSKVQSSEQKLSSLSAKSAEPTIRAIDNASTIIHHVIGELNNIPRNVETTITTTHVNKNVTINEAPKAYGTLTPAKASGTAYNVLNYRPAYKDGKIALSKDELALVNELGTESIIL